MAQLVEHHLAKVRVAGSNPVVRSKRTRKPRVISAVEWPRGEAVACKAAYTGSNPVSTSTTKTMVDWRSWLARFLDMEEVTGSSPVSTTLNVFWPRDLRHLISIRLGNIFSGNHQFSSQLRIIDQLLHHCRQMEFPSHTYDL